MVRRSVGPVVGEEVGLMVILVVGFMLYCANKAVFSHGCPITESCAKGPVSGFVLLTAALHPDNTIVLTVLPL